MSMSEILKAFLGGLTQETEKNTKFVYTIFLQNHASQHKADLCASKLHLTFI